MTAVINDDVERSQAATEGREKLRVTLVALDNLDPLLRERRLVVEVKADDSCSGKEGLPHSQGLPAREGIGIATNPDLKEGDRSFAQVTQMLLISVRIRMRTLLVGAVLDREIAEGGSSHRREV